MQTQKNYKNIGMHIPVPNNSAEPFKSYVFYPKNRPLSKNHYIHSSSGWGESNEELGLLGQIFETAKNTYFIEHIISYQWGESDENEPCRT